MRVFEPKGFENKKRKNNDFIKLVCGTKKSRFINKQEANCLLLGTNSPFSRIPLLGSIL